MGIRKAMKTMESQDDKESPGLDGISNRIIGECSEHLADIICSVTEMPSAEGKVPSNWKR